MEMREGITPSFYVGGLLVGQTMGMGVDYLHQDALGSTRLVMPASMVTSFSSNYMPYGMSYAVTGEEAFQYTGKLMDEATGLYYEGARYYDPTTGRFITEDSVVGSTSDPQSLNRYVYARDNPMKIVDMNGHEWWNPVADISSAVSTVVGTATNVANSVSNAWNSLPPDEQAGIIAGVAAVATVGLCLTVIGCLAAPEIDLGAAAAVAGVAGTGAVADAAPEITPDAATITSTIDEGLMNGIAKQMTNTLENPGPQETIPKKIGEWGQTFMKPLMNFLGLNDQVRITTPRGDVYPDFLNPITKLAVDIKTGNPPLDEQQASKYELAQLTDQISNVLYVNIPNPWTGVTTPDSYAQQIVKWGFTFLRTGS